VKISTQPLDSNKNLSKTSPMISIFLLVTVLSVGTAWGKQKQKRGIASEEVKGEVFFVSPKEGETVNSPFKVKMGVKGIKIRPADESPDEKTSGHHHIIVDGGSITAGVPIPKDDKHLHFGKGQTETELKLSPGAHTLTLQFADGAHRSYGDKLSKTIRITVK
jgi:hypothetical protein